MENRNEIIEKIHEAITAVHKKEDVELRSGWTDEFKKALITVGETEGYKVYASTKERRPGMGEWLVDLCWSIDGNNKDSWRQNYRGLKLVCEIEWNMNENDILYDFQKLAVVKAEIKLMIVQFNEDKDFDKWKKDCENSVDRTLWDDGSTYILCGSQNGKDGKLRFVRLWNK